MRSGSCCQGAALALPSPSCLDPEACLACSFVQGYDERDPKTHKGYNLRKMPMGAVYKEYGLDPMTVDFIGHAIALHRCATCALGGRAGLISHPYPTASLWLAYTLLLSLLHFSSRRDAGLDRSLAGVSGIRLMSSR